jgi:hypothetical protein
MPNLAPGTVTTVSATGAAVTYTVTGPGTVTFKMWGAAGGQSLLSTGANSASRGNGFGGGGGGYTTLSVRVVTNDVIKIEVGKGGVGSKSTTPQARGVGGYPDGGSGAVASSAGGTLFYAGGGGSTRVYLNNTLIAVAGGGGAGGGGITGSGGVTGKGAPGGGANGRGSPPNSSNLGATGGSQSAGGVNNNVPSDTGFQGGSLQGGNGFSSANASPTTVNATANMAGPAGGGGYFGGGGNSDGTGSAGRATGGAGGSGYVNTAHAAVLGGNTFQGYGHLPGGGQDADFPGGGIATGRITTTSPFDGGDGSVVMRFAAQITLTNGTKQAVTYTGGAVDYICPQTGSIIVKAWGSSGGGTTRNGTATNGGQSGAGGFTTFQFNVVANDIITVEVGRGGRGGTTTNFLGEGGWPDGGRGSIDGSIAGTTNNFGGGGGSTRIYRNGTLVGVAGAGGGASMGLSAPTTAKAGAGGGTSGTTADTIGTALGGTGATQSAGGTNPNSLTSSDTGFFGAHLFGGEGFFAAGWDASLIQNSGGLNKTGPGGGGGYYGGGGDAPVNSTNGSAAGGGGSSWWEPTLTGLVNASTSAGSGTTAGGSADTDYVLAGSPGAGKANTVGGDGNNGASVLLFTAGYLLPGPITVSNLITDWDPGRHPDRVGEHGHHDGPQPVGSAGTPTGDIGTVR